MAGPDPDTAADDGDDGEAPPKKTLWERITLLMVKAENPDDTRRRSGVRTDDEGPSTVDELEAAVARADDKERAVGLIAAPVAAAISILLTGSLISNDPAALTSRGLVNTHHVNPSLYVELGAVACALSVLMLVMALWRKRLYLGIVLALWGLSIFNLHFWGFGIPFLLVGAWYIVRAYRLTQKLKLAKAEGGDGPSTGRPRPGAPNKRYTPPTGR